MFKTNGLLIAAVIGAFFLYNSDKKANSGLDEATYLKAKAELSHSLAQETALQPIPTPEPDINVIPELAKCPLCKGTKKITHADGHQTPCPYHGNANEELEDHIMELSARIAEKEKDFLTVMADLKATKGRLALIDQAHKPETKLVANSCPCGCSHLVKDCNCAASCPGKKLDVYTTVSVSKPILSPEMREIRQERRIERTPIKTVLPPYPMIQNGGFGIECSNGSCTSTRRPIIRRFGRWR